MVPVMDLNPEYFRVFPNFITRNGLLRSLGEKRRFRRLVEVLIGMVIVSLRRVGRATLREVVRPINRPNERRILV
jgi:hypothetical protein